LSERQTQREIVEYLRATGWKAKVFSSNRRQPSQLRDWPDVVAFRHDHCLLVECKSETGRLRKGQTAFRDELRDHLGLHVRYVVARSLADVEAASRL